MRWKPFLIACVLAASLLILRKASAERAEDAHPLVSPELSSVTVPAVVRLQASGIASNIDQRHGFLRFVSPASTVARRLIRLRATRRRCE